MPYDFPSSPVDGQVYDNFVYSSAKQSWVLADSVEALGPRVANAERLAPIGSIHMFAGSTAPRGYLLCEGQAVSRDEFARLFTQTGTTYGVGNGSTTFNLPDLRGRTVAGVQSAVPLGTATITIASPAVVTEPAHGLSTGQIVSFTTTGALPTGVVVGTRYWAIVLNADTFRLATSLANAFSGTAINTSGTQSGTHTAFRDNYALGQAGGAETHAMAVTELPSHTHGQNSHNHFYEGTTSTDGNHAHNYSINLSTAVFTQAGGTGMDRRGSNNALTTADGNHSHTLSGTTGGVAAGNQNTGSSSPHNNLQPYNTVNYIIKF
jgi:microcystin-dependent protein